MTKRSESTLFHYLNRVIKFEREQNYRASQHDKEQWNGSATPEAAIIKNWNSSIVRECATCFNEQWAVDCQ